jgi:hypothetical protein
MPASDWDGNFADIREIQDVPASDWARTLAAGPSSSVFLSNSRFAPIHRPVLGR